MARNLQLPHTYSPNHTYLPDEIAMISPFLMSFGVTRRLLKAVRVRTYIYTTLIFLVIVFSQGIEFRMSSFTLYGYRVGGDALLVMRVITLFFLWVIVPIFIHTALAVHHKSFTFVCKMSKAQPSAPGVLGGHIWSILIYFATPILVLFSILWIIVTVMSPVTEPVLLALPVFCVTMFACGFTFVVFLRQIGWPPVRSGCALAITTITIAALQIFSLVSEPSGQVKALFTSAVVSTFDVARWLVPDLVRISGAALALPDASIADWFTLLNTMVLALAFFGLTHRMIGSRA